MGKQYKTCSKCKETKPVSEFNKHETNKDRLNGQCKSCQTEYARKQRKKNPEKERKASEKWRKENPEKYRETYKKWQKANPEKIKKYREENREKIKNLKKKWKEATPEKVKEQGKKDREKNREKTRECSRNWRNKNIKHCRKICNQYIQNRRTTDPLFKLRRNMQNFVRDSLKKQGYTKQSKTYKILGIDYDNFYNWLNTIANNGFNYANDKVHIDHVIPISLGQTEEEVLILSHYSNLQLLSVEENSSKKNYYIYKNNLNRVLKYHPNPELLKKIITRSNIKLIDL